MGAFHAYDIRGVFGVDFDESTAYKVGYFLPELLGADKILVGRDCRLSSETIRNSLVEGILDSGKDVADIGLSSTPLVYFATAAYGFKASVQITASHNSKEYNGMKVSRENALPVGLDTGLGQIKEWIEQDRPCPKKQRGTLLETPDVLGDYLRFMEKFRGDFSGLKIVFDLSNGMANLTAKPFFGEGPTYIGDNLDGNFPLHDPNPLIAKNTLALRERVRKEKADIGVIYDGDADRVMFIDENGDFVSPDLVVALMAKYFCDMRGFKSPRVLQEIRSSKAVAEYLQKYDADVHTWRVGRAFAAPKLREIDGLWGGELAGHYYFKEFFYSDSGLLSSIIVLNILAQLKKEGLTLSKAMSSLKGYFNSGEINFRLEDKQGAMQAVCAHFRESLGEPDRFMDFDGFRLEYPSWWFNIRPSNTEPYLRFICEASTQAELEQRIAEVTDLLTKNFNAQKA